MRKVVLFSCTNRSNSYSDKVTNVYKQLFENEGLETEVVYFKDLPENLITHELFGTKSEEFQNFLDTTIGKNNKFLFVLAEYNGSFPGLFKVFMDAVPPKLWQNKKACLVGVSSGRAGNLRGMDHANGVLQYLKMIVHHNKLPISQIDKIMDANGSFFKQEQLAVCRSQVKEFIDL
jgi:NAD(P)H-dependent FMN reductase